MPRISSDPNAWLRPHYGRISAEPGFSQLAPSHQFVRLVAAIAPDYPKQAALMNEYNDATQRATLGHLHKMQVQQPLRREEPLDRQERRSAAAVRCGLSAVRS